MSTSFYWRKTREPKPIRIQFGWMKVQPDQTYLDRAFIAIHRYWLTISSLFPLWYSLDHAGRIAPKLLREPWLPFIETVLLVVAEHFSRPKTKGMVANISRLRWAHFFFAAGTVIFLIYNVITRDVQMHDGLIDIRILFGLMILIGSSVPMYKTLSPERNQISQEPSSSH